MRRDPASGSGRCSGTLLNLADIRGRNMKQVTRITVIEFARCVRCTCMNGIKRRVDTQLEHGTLPARFNATRALEFEGESRNIMRPALYKFPSDDVSREAARNFWVRFSEPIRLRYRWLSARSFNRPPGYN